MTIVEDKLGKIEHLLDEKIIVSTYKGRANSDLALEHLAKVISIIRMK